MQSISSHPPQKHLAKAKKGESSRMTKKERKTSNGEERVKASDEKVKEK